MGLLFIIVKLVSRYHRDESFNREAESRRDFDQQSSKNLIIASTASYSASLGAMKCILI